MELFVLYLFIGLLVAYACKGDDDRTLLISNPPGGILIALFWPLVLWAIFPNIESFKFRGKTRYKRP